MFDPLNIYAIDDITMITGLNVKPVMSKKRDIFSAIEVHYAKQTAERAAEDIQKQYENVAVEDHDSEDVTNAPNTSYIGEVIQTSVLCPQ